MAISQAISPKELWAANKGLAKLLIAFNLKNPSRDPHKAEEVLAQFVQERDFTQKLENRRIAALQAITGTTENRDERALSLAHEYLVLEEQGAVSLDVQAVFNVLSQLAPQAVLKAMAERSYQEGLDPISQVSQENLSSVTKRHKRLISLDQKSAIVHKPQGSAPSKNLTILPKTVTAASRFRRKLEVVLK